MKTRLLLSTMALAAATAGLGIAQAATPVTAQPPVASTKQAEPGPQAKPSPMRIAHRARRRAASGAPRTSAMDRTQQQVMLARSAEQRRRISDGLRHGRLASAQAGALRSWLARLDDQQTVLSRRGHETVEEALALSHQQDLLDWSIRTGHTEFQPGRPLAGS